jgi:hypothetical protein
MLPDVAVPLNVMVTEGDAVVAEGEKVAPVPVYPQLYSSVFGSALTEMTNVAPSQTDWGPSVYVSVPGLRHSAIAG